MGVVNEAVEDGVGICRVAMGCSVVGLQDTVGEKAVDDLACISHRVLEDWTGRGWLIGACGFLAF